MAGAAKLPIVQFLARIARPPRSHADVREVWPSTCPLNCTWATRSPTTTSLSLLPPASPTPRGHPSDLARGDEAGARVGRAHDAPSAPVSAPALQVPRLCRRRMAPSALPARLANAVR